MKKLQARETQSKPSAIGRTETAQSRLSVIGKGFQAIGEMSVGRCIYPFIAGTSGDMPEHLLEQCKSDK